MLSFTFRQVIVIVSQSYLFALFACAQGISGGSRSVAMGGATTALIGEAWGYANPASWTTVPTRTLAFFASEAFGLAELRQGAVQIVEPRSWGSIVFGFQTFGYEEYRESFFTVGYADSFSPGTTRPIYAGFRLRYYHIVIPDYGSARSVAISIGIQVEVVPGLYFGCFAENVNDPKLTDSEKLPQSFSMGFGYLPDPRVYLLFDIYKDTRFPPSVRSGLEYHLVSALKFRVGIATKPNRFAAGLGLLIGRFTSDIAAQRHEVLGWSPAVSLGIHW